MWNHVDFLTPVHPQTNGWNATRWAIWERMAIESSAIDLDILHKC